MAQKINVDTTPGLLMPTLYYSQGDIGRVFEINLSSKDGFTIPAGATVKMVATKPSGFGFEVTGTLTGSVASFTTTETMTNEAGRYPAEIRIESSGDVIGTANFMLSGEINPHPDGTVDGDAEEIIPELTLLVERAETAAELLIDCSATAVTLAAGSDATASYSDGVFEFGIPKGADGSLSSNVLAPTYSSSATYAVGDYVYYSGSLYRCTTAITTAEAWTAAHWTSVALGNDVTDLKSALNDIGNLEDIVRTIKVSDFAHGDVRSGSLVESNAFAYSSTMLPLSVGDIYFDDSKYQLIFLQCDTSGNVTAYSSARTTSPAEPAWVRNKLQLYDKNNQAIVLADADASTYYIETKETKLVDTISTLCDDTYETKVEDVNLTEDLTNICYADNGGVGSTISENGSAETQFKAIVVPVKSGDSFKITGTGGSAYRLWCFTDTSRKILSVANAWATATASTITASANGYLYFQISTAYAYSIIQLSKSVKYIRAEEDYKYLLTMTGLGMFQSIAGIGDSYTEGDMVKADSTWVTKAGINYLSAIGKRNGITANNYGSGGATTETYLSRQAFADALADTPSDFYIFALGQNDINEATTKGTIADIKEDYTQNPNSFYGNYGRIISQIKNHAPNARFIIMGSWVKGISSASGLDYQSYNDAIEEIAEHYGFPYVNPFDDDFFDSKLYNNNMSSGHPTAMGYIGMSYAVERLFSKCVQENSSYFKYALLD